MNCITLDTFTRIDGFACQETGKWYNNLYEAKTDCSLSKTCIWVMDSQCNDDGFELCAKSDKLDDSQTSCVYEKIEYRGKFISKGRSNRPY